MTLTSTKAPGVTTPMSRLVTRLQGRFQELSLNFQAWDSLCRPLSPPQAGNRLCQGMTGLTAQCTESMGEAACRALAQKAPVRASAPCGGCVLAVPVIRRRRVLGAVTTCYPAWEALADGSLRRHWRRSATAQGQDFAQVAAEAVRLSRAQGGDFLKIMGWMIDSEQETDIARSETENLSNNLANTYEELSLLYLISGSMKVNQAPAAFFGNICENLVEVMHISGAAAVVYGHPPGGGEPLVVQAGELGLSDEQVRALATDHVAPRFAHHRAAVDNDFRVEGGASAMPVDKLIAAPMVADDRLMGMLIGFNKARGDFDSVDLKLISSLANQAAVFVSNNRLYAEVQDLLMGVLHALTASIDAKDPYTSGHSERVAVIARKIAQQMGLPPGRAENIYLAGLLHDVGKIGVSENVLRKPGRLTEEEFAQVRQHPAIGERILGSIRQLHEIVPGISTHHERFDGEGYPRGLRGDQVPQDGLIVGLADAFDAMTSERTYRRALPLVDVLEEVRRASGTQFSPPVVKAFLSLDVPKLLEELRQQPVEDCGEGVSPLRPAGILPAASSSVSSSSSSSSESSSPTTETARGQDALATRDPAAGEAAP